MSAYLWDSLWLNANLACMSNSGLGIIHNGALATKNGIISWIGSEQDLPGQPEQLAQELVNANNNWLLPGFIDCHTHLVYAGNRSHEFEARVAGVSYEEIAHRGGGILSTVVATRAASDDEIFDQSAVRLEAMIAEGVTTIEIKSGYGLDLDTELRMLSIARRLAQKYPLSVYTTLLAAHSLPKEFMGRADDYIDMVCEKILPEAYRQNLVDAVDAFCERIAFSRAQVERIFIKARELGLALKIHAEQLSDQQGAMLAAKYQALSADHLEYLSEAGVKALAQSGTVAVLLPGAAYYLQSAKIPPIESLRKYDVPIAIATDANPGSSPIFSPLLILNMACIVYRLSPVEALLGLSYNAARALGCADIIGSLELGKQADFVEWQINQPIELCYQIGLNRRRRMVKAGIVVRT